VAGFNLQALNRDAIVITAEPADPIFAASARFYEAFASWQRSRSNAARAVVENAFTVRHAVPAICPYREFAVAGGLMSYGTDIPNLYRRSASTPAAFSPGLLGNSTVVRHRR
jgi:hypothetical protein